MPQDPGRSQGEAVAKNAASSPVSDDAAGKLKKYVRIFLVPMLVTKSCVLYFGLKYSEFPDEGYGYGLAAAIAATLFNFALFVYMNWKDGESESP